MDAAQAALKERQALVDKYQKDFEESVRNMTPEDQPPPQTIPDGAGGEITLNSGIDPVEAARVIADATEKTFAAVKADVERLIASKPTSIATKAIDKFKDIGTQLTRDMNERNLMPRILEIQAEHDVPDPARQWAITKSLEANNKGPLFDALSPEEQKIAEKWDGLLKAANEEYVKNDIGPVLNESGDFQHIYHHWIDPKTGEPYRSTYGRFSRKSPVMKERSMATFESGEAAGLQPATVNFGKLIGMQLRENGKVRANQIFFESLASLKPDVEIPIERADGRMGTARMVEPWRDLEKNGMTGDYERVDNPAFNRKSRIELEDGTIMQIDGSVGVQKELAPWFKAFIADVQYTTFDKVLSVARSLKLSGSFYHARNLVMNNVQNFRNPFAGMKTGDDLIMNPDADMITLYRNGLKHHYEDFSGMNISLKVPVTSDYATLRGGAHVANAVTYVPREIVNLTFGVIQPRMKVQFAYDVFQDIKQKYVDAGLSIDQAARDAVKMADQNFSGEDMRLAMLETNKAMVKFYYSEGGQKFWSRALISSLWQLEHIRKDASIVKSFLPDAAAEKLGMDQMPPALKGKYRQLAYGAALMYAAANIYNLATTKYMDGRAHTMWDNPEGVGFGGIRMPFNTPEYTEVTEDGRQIYHAARPAYFDPFKSLLEVPHMISDLANGEFSRFWSKVNPLVSATVEVGGKIKNKELTGWEGVGTGVVDWATGSFSPIPFSGLKPKKDFPYIDKEERKNWFDIAMGFSGLGNVNSPYIKDERPYYMDWMTSDREGKDKALQKMKEAGITFNADRPMSVVNDAEGKVKALLLRGDETGAANAVEEWNNTMSDQRYRIYLTKIKAEIMKANSSRQRDQNKSKAIQ